MRLGGCLFGHPTRGLVDIANRCCGSQQEHTKRSEWENAEGSVNPGADCDRNEQSCNQIVAGTTSKLCYGAR